jgi:hypothetical protein
MPKCAIRLKLACSLALGCVVLLQPASGATWAMLRDEQGTAVPYPADIFTVKTTEPDIPGEIYTTADGRARLHVFVRQNERNETPAQFIKRVIVDDRRNLTYQRVTRDFFVFSAPEGDRILYRRCNFARDRRIHCVDLRYPRGEKRAWDAIVTRISLSLRPR